MTPDLLARSLQEFLADSCSAVVLEDGQVLFDLETAQYSLSSEKDRCLFHLWSAERNLIRHVLDAELKNGTLTLTVRRFGHTRPIKMEICRDRDRRPPTVQKATRSRYARLLERALRCEMPGWALDKTRLSTSMDLERSFSPVYARGLVRKGRSAFAVMGVNQQETQASVDAALTFGLLWLDACREREAGRSLVEGLRLYVPPKSSATLQVRLAHLNHAAAKFQLFEFDERDESSLQIDLADHGNIHTRLVRLPDAAQVRSRFAAIVSRIVALAPQAEIAVVSATELSFRLHGLELARASLANAPGTFQVEEEIVFGPPGYETRLNDETAPAFEEFIKTVVEARSPNGDRRDPLWRMYPERWLESLSSRMFPPWIPAWIRRTSIRRCRRFRLQTAR